MTGQTVTGRTVGTMTKPGLVKADKVLLALVIVQILIALAVFGETITTLFGLRSQPQSWQVHEIFEISAVAGLLLGAIAGGALIFRIRRQITDMRSRLRVASDAFAALVDKEFAAWGLTPTEREVATLMLKGYSNGEISALTNKAEGTVKAQCSAVFRKAGVSGRGQLVSSFFEVLLVEPLSPAA